MALPAIGWIGTGVMGKSMCGHLIKAGYPAHIYTRNKEKAQELIAMGGTWCESPGELAKKTSIIFSIVGFPCDVEEVMLSENGVLAHAPKNAIVVDMTTSNPSLARKIYAKAKEKGIAALDAPVSGGDMGAKNATLAIMVGGEPETFHTVKPLFQCMGENLRLMGPAGTGQHCKMANQILIAGTMIGVVESLLYTVKAGLDMDGVIDVIGSGAASSWSINNLGRRIAAHDFSPGFYIKHFIKDMGIALEESQAMGLALPGLALVHQFYLAAKAQGLENLGTQGLYKACQAINGMDI